MVDVIPKIVKNLWDIWNIRVTVLVSLFLQTLLILLAPNRKHSSNRILAFFMWSGYLLADAIANYTIGLIVSLVASNQCNDLSNNDCDLLVLWSPFLIVHLGGPDTITALALEDNELWLRHFLTLVFQVVATLYVFLLSLPKNKLMIPTILMFLSGCIKYLERTRSLYLASGDRIPKTMGNNPRTPNMDVDYDSKIKRSSGQVDDLQLVRAAYRCTVISLIPNPKKSIDGREVLKKQGATTVLRVLEVELNFLYDILFTKTLVVHTSMGFFFRFFSFCCIITSLAVFHFHITKHGVFNGINVTVTYVLFLGAVALELIALLMAVLSDWTVDTMIESEESSNPNLWRKIVARVSKFLHLHSAFGKIWSYWTPHWYLEEAKKGAQPVDEELRTPHWYLEHAEDSAQLHNLIWYYCLEDRDVEELRTPLLSRRWSGCLSGHNLIRYCLKGWHSGIIVKAMDWVIDRVGLRDLLDEMSCLSREPLRKNLWILIFQQLKDKSGHDALSRIDFLKEKSNSVQLSDVLKNGCIQNHSYDESLVLWHVATDLLYNDKQHPANIVSVMSKTLSDYMMYLLIMKPDILAPVADEGKTKFQETCTEAKKFFEGKDLGELQNLEPPNDGYPCLLSGAIKLAKELQKSEDKKKWEFISQFWVESLCYAASHCSLKVHARQLRKGGELITFVWLLMQHFSLWYSFERRKFPMS